MTRDDAIAQALAENMVDGVYQRLIERYLEADDDGWRNCCLSNCDPCVQTIGRVVDRARELMASEPTH